MSRLLLVSLMVSTAALGQWSAQTSGTTNVLNAVWFVSPTAGFLAGDAGTSLRTTDGGASWNQFNLTGDDLEDMAFIGSSNGLIVGDNGRIFFTTDGGASFNSASSGTSSNLRAAAMGDDGIAHAAGRDGVILRSTNSGATWQGVETGTVEWEGLWARGYANAWLVGREGNMKRTTDAGATWQTVTSGTSSDLKNVFFIDADNGWAVGQNSTVIRTTNGGVSWAASNSGVNQGMDAVHFISPTEGWIAGDNGAIYHTTNSGANWVLETSGTTSPFEDVFFYAGVRGWAVGNSGVIVSRQLAGIEEQENVGTRSSVLRAFPNPLAAQGRVSLNLAHSGPVTLAVIDASGRRVKTLVQQNLPTGRHDLTWDRRSDAGRAVSAGVYYYELRTGSAGARLPVVVVSSGR